MNIILFHAEIAEFELSNYRVIKFSSFIKPICMYIYGYGEALKRTQIIASGKSMHDNGIAYHKNWM